MPKLTSRPVPKTIASQPAPTLIPHHTGTLNADIWRTIVEEDYSTVLRMINWDALFPKGAIPTQLLDIGCGIGTFPHMLRPHLPPDTPIFYDYMDPAHYCLSMCQQVLHPPYQARRAYHTPIEEASLHTSTTRYDIIWALQSLYGLTPRSLPKAIGTINKALNPHRGTVIIMLPKQDAFIPQIYERYTKLFSHNKTRQYLTAEPVLGALSNQAMPAIVREIDCTHTISIRDEYRLEQYLQQCIMDSQPPEGWRHHPQMRDFIDSFRHVDVYRFPNPTWIILGAPGQSKLAGRRRILTYLEPVTTQIAA
ncbi:methyltransferase domain-containing protein [Nitrospira sp. M1]